MKRLLTPREVADLYGVNTRTLEYWRRTNQGPIFLRLSPRVIRYALADVMEYAEGSGLSTRDQHV